VSGVALRPVEDGDLPLFYVWQADEESFRMAAVAPRDEEAFAAHWARYRPDPAGTMRTIVADGEVAGHVVAWSGEDGRMVGYWIGRPFWGRGIASEALGLFLLEEAARPLLATVAAHNAASQRVLEKAGFELVGREPADDVELLLFRLDDQPSRSSTSS
jgi:RimJ/RimL family protein N-acetyltransferase